MTSVSTVRTEQSSTPAEVHGLRELQLWCLLLHDCSCSSGCSNQMRTLLVLMSVVTYTCLSDSQMNSSTLDVSKANSFFLFAELRRKSTQFRGSLVSPDTFMRTPLPLFSRVDSFRLPAKSESRFCIDTYSWPHSATLFWSTLILFPCVEFVLQ